MAYIRTVAGSGGTVDIDTTNNKATATTTSETYSPATDKVFADFTVNPQQHSGTYTPSANKSNNDMSAIHNYRYVNTSGMYLVDQGTYNYGTVSGTGSKTISGLTRYNAVTFNIPTPQSVILVKSNHTSSTKQNFTDAANKVNCTNISGYSSLTTSNFLICPVMPSSGNYMVKNSTTSSKDGGYQAESYLYFKYQYTASTGTLGIYCFIRAWQKQDSYEMGNKSKAIPCNIYVKP